MPPNTEAHVALPGSDGEVVRVGGGAHRWRYGVDDVTFHAWSGLRPYGANTSLKELRANDAAWSVIDHHAPEFAQRFADDDGNADRTFVTAASMASVDAEVRKTIVAQLSTLGPPLPEAPEPIGV